MPFHGLSVAEAAAGAEARMVGREDDPGRKGGDEQAWLALAVARSPAIHYLAATGGPGSQTSLRFVSRNVEAVTGRPARDFLDDPGLHFRCIHPDDRAAYLAGLATLDADRGHDQEYRFADANGGFLRIRDSLRPIDGEHRDGDEATFAGCMIDVSAPDRGEAAPGADRPEFRALVEQHPLPLLLLEADSGRIVYQNPAAAALTGREERGGRGGRPDAAPAALQQHLEPADCERWLAALQRNGELLNHELPFRRADGAIAWVAANARLLEERGRRYAIAGLVDLGAQRAREAELSRARETLEDAIESLSEGFALFDADDRLVMCNSQFRAFNERTEDVLRPGVSWIEFNRIGAERGQYVAAEGRLAAWLEETTAERGKATNWEFEQSDGRWFEYSHRTTRQNGLVVTRRDITERKRMESALREEQELVRRVLESAPVPISMTRLRDRLILYESPAMSAIFLEDDDTRAAHAGTHDIDPSQRVEYLRRIAEEGAVDNFEIDFRRLDGSEFTGAVSGRRIDYHGEPSVVAVTIDLTEIKSRESELRQARETLEDAIESLNEGFVLFDADERFVMCNKRYLEFNRKSADKLKPGVPRVEFLRAALERGQYPDLIGREREILEDYAKGGLAANLGRAFEFEQDDGRWFIGSNQRTRQGGFVGTRIDITERKKIERALQQSESMLRGVLDACPLPITMYRIDDGAIVYESPAAQQLFGVQDGKPTVRADWASRAQLDAFLEALSASRALDGVEVQFHRADGEPFWAAVSARLIEYGGERVVVSAVYDLTERRAAEDKIAQQRELLHQSEKLSALGEVLAGVAHELNNPLSVVVGQAHMLQQDAADPQIAERAAKIGAAANRCARIVKTFLSMARHQPAEQRPVEVNRVIEAALEVTAYSLRAAGIRVSRRLAKDLPTILADDQQVQQVITNLVINAQHALESVDGERKLHVTTSLRKKSGEVVIKVKDNGPGVPEDIRGRIFEPLFTTKAVGTGTGIGLALCHRLVESHGGSIEIEGPPDQGAVFVVRFPVAGDTAVERAAPEARATAARRDRVLRILVIDDEPDVADYLAEVLEVDGHEVAVSTTGADTLRRLESQSFDVILSDIRMPEVDGPALHKILSERWPELVPVLAFITGDTLSSRVKAFLDGSGRPFVEKPVTPAEVRELVARVAKDD
jgi:PAS domain S-box-containing protein